jgi:hypothetical protein
MLMTFGTGRYVSGVRYERQISESGVIQNLLRLFASDGVVGKEELQLM